MKIQWFPGHMHKARTEVAEMLPKVDLFIEVLDARIPFSSENPMLEELRGNKRCIKLLNKSDLSDQDRTEEWLKDFGERENVKAFAVSTSQPERIRQLTTHCRKMFPERGGVGASIKAMIVGIPNVGKSTLINILAGRSIARTGNEPAITKGQQRINIGKGIILHDTPGMLWPNVENRNSGFRLAATGAIKDTAMDYDDVGLFAAEFLLAEYPDRMANRYKLEGLPQSGIEALESIAKKRGCLSKRGIVDYDRVGRILLNELRSGKLGGITLETPEIMRNELAELEVLRETQSKEKAERKASRKARFKERQRERRRE